MTNYFFINPAAGQGKGVQKLTAEIHRAAEALQLPGQMRWYQLHGGSIRNFKDFFVIAGYFLILTGMEGVIFVRVVKRRAQNG